VRRTDATAARNRVRQSALQTVTGESAVVTKVREAYAVEPTVRAGDGVAADHAVANRAIGAGTDRETVSGDESGDPVGHFLTHSVGNSVQSDDVRVQPGQTLRASCTGVERTLS